MQTAQSQLQPIEDVFTPQHQGIILVKQSAMQEIFLKSGPNAKSNEFQVHYWALNLRFRGEDNSILDICIPTCYFNYPQEVSPGHIDFELKDVIEASEKVLPLHNMAANKLLQTDFKDKLETSLGVKLESSAVNYHSIHRHPGRSSHQSFSGTDLCKTAKEPGVVYPIQSANEDRPNFAGIMAIDDGQCRVAHYEYRTVNGTLGKDILYKKGGCTAVIIDDPQPLSQAQTLTGQIPIDPSYCKTSGGAISELVFEKLRYLIADIDYTPSTHAINPDNVTKTAVTWKGSNTSRHKINQHFNNKKEKTQLEVYKSLTLLEKTVLAKKLKPELIELISELIRAYYMDSTADFADEHISKLDPMGVAELLEEYEYMKDNIIDEYNQMNEESKNEKEIAEMIDELSGFGIQKSQLVLATDKQIKEWYTKSIGE